MAKVNLACLDLDLNPVTLGTCDLPSAIEELKKRHGNGLRSYEWFEESYVATYMCVSRSSEDFLELTCHGQDQVGVWSDRLEYSSIWSRLFAIKKWIIAEVSLADAEAMLRDYFEMDRSSFEAHYLEYYARD